MKSPGRPKGGFSFIELMIVIGLSALMITMVAVNLSFFDHLLVQIEAQKLLMTCRRLQYQAISTNQEQILTFDPINHSYTYATTTIRLNRSVSFGAHPAIQGPPSHPTHPIANPITFAQKRIVFTPDGIIQPGSLYLTSKDKQILYALCSPVSQVSFLRLYRYDHGWHCLT